MAMYATLYKFTDQGIRAVRESPDRVRAATEAAAGVGIKLHGVYYLHGPYDMIVISEADDEKTATAFALTTASQGNVTSTTMRAFPLDEFEEIVGRMPG